MFYPYFVWNSWVPKLSDLSLLVHIYIWEFSLKNYLVNWSHKMVPKEYKLETYLALYKSRSFVKYCFSTIDSSKWMILWLRASTLEGKKAESSSLSLEYFERLSIFCNSHVSSCLWHFLLLKRFDVTCVSTYNTFKSKSKNLE